MKERHAPSVEESASPPVTSASSYRPVLALAFFACFLWLLFVSSSWFEGPSLSSEASVLVGIFTPLVAATAIVYPSVLFRDRPPALRMVMLFSFSFVLLVLAVALLMLFFVALFAFGIISPE